MAPPPDAVKVLERSQVSPPPGSVPTTCLPLTFFDIPWLLCRHMQRLYFYEFPYSTHHFLQSFLPNLKNSLSLILRYFFPFAGELVFPPSPPAKPHILYTDGGSMQFTVAESVVDFNSLFAIYPRAVEELHPFVPNLPPASVQGGARVAPLLALQVTVFPNSGICIGVRFSHVVADGRAFHHFMKSWALVCKTGGELTCLGESLPSHNRAAIEDPDGLEPAFLNEWWNLASAWDEGACPTHDSLAEKVRATIIMDQAEIEKLKRWVTYQLTEDDDDNDSASAAFHVSSFVVTCALVWVCLIKSQETNFLENDNNGNENDKPYYFIFVADCRNRLTFSIPETYFGNCLSLCFVSVKRNELLGENGIIAATKAIGKRVGELERGALKGADEWMLKWKEVVELYKHVTVAESPKLRVYDSDFGWGRPKRTESVQIDASEAISLVENGDQKNGGVEVALALNRTQMGHFQAILHQILKLI